MVTIDLNNLLYIILIAVAIILLIFLIVAVARLKQTLKRLNGILEDVSTVSGIVSEKAIETKPVVDDLSKTIASFASAAAGNESRVASLSSIAKSISSLISLIKNGKN